MRMSERGILDLVADEGEVLVAYRDLVGVLTIGVGLTAKSGVIVPKPGMRITKEESRRLLRLALERNYEPAVNRALGQVKQHEFDPAVSFHFNTGAISRASWVNHFKAGRMSEARSAFLAWNKAGGRVVRGLASRREREWTTLSSGIYHTGPASTLPPPAEFDVAVERSVIKLGDRGSDVSSLQSNLKELGYYAGNVDGIFGPRTDEAVRRFQQSHPNLAVDGRAGTATLTTIQRMLDAKRRGKQTGGSAVVGSLGGGAANELTGGASGLGSIEVMLIILLVVGLIGVYVAWQCRDEIKAFLRKEKAA